MTEYLLDILLPFAITFAFSFFIGLERQNIGKSAGISSHVIVSLAACGIAIMQRYIAKEHPTYDGQRIIAQVVSGLGFLGAGIILKSSKTVKGLTTATTLWGSAMAGLITGMQYYAIGVTLGVGIVLFMYLRDASRKINPFVKHKNNKNKDEIQKPNEDHDGEDEIDH